MRKIFILIGCLFVLCIAPSALAQEVMQPETVAIRVTVAAHDQTLFDGMVSVAPCDSDGVSETQPTITGYCAVKQLGLAETWSWWESDAFLDSLSGFASDYGQNWYWSWFHGLELGQTALNKHQVTSGEHLLITYNTYPLRLGVDTQTPSVGAAIRFTGERFGYDASWNPVWFPAVNGTLTIGSMAYTLSETGIYDLVIDDGASTTAYLTLPGFVQSPVLIIAPVAAAALEPAPISEPVAPMSTGGGASSAGAQRDDFNLGKAVTFLVSFQKDDGSFGDDRYTDWATIALAAVRSKVSAADKALELGRAHLVSDSLSKNARLTDYERRALALMAARVNPYDGTPFNYIEAIVDEFDGEQFGDADQENDDVFALLVLLKAGYDEGDEMIRALVAHLLKKQKSSGEWFGVDLTAAALQALSMIESYDKVRPAIERARAYLASQQRGDGSLGNAFSESWALQALGFDDWLLDMDEVFADRQESDGGVLAMSESDDNRLWATAYAIPAYARKSWPTIMKSFKRPVTPVEETAELVEERAQETDGEGAVKNEPVLSPTVLGAFTEDAQEDARQMPEVPFEVREVEEVSNSSDAAPLASVMENQKSPRGSALLIWVGGVTLLVACFIYWRFF